MNNFLAKLKPDTKVTIGVSISPNVGLEMMEIDPTTHKVMKYARRDLPYNPSIREIEDYGELKQNLNDLFNELKVLPQNAKVILNMPNVAFGHMFLPTVLDDDAVTTTLMSEVEQGYLFKKNTPVVSWTEVKENNSSQQRYVLYAAMQEEVLNIIKQIFTDLGVTLLAVDNAYSSLIRTLQYTEITKDFATSGSAWNILLVTQNSFVVFSMLGYGVLEYYEEPIAIKAFNNDEVYIAIAQASSAIMEKYPSDKLLVVSESNDVSAEILSMQLRQQGDVIFLECNQYAKNTIMDVDLNILPHYVKAITPEIIGVSVYTYGDFDLKLNFLAKTDYKAPDTVRIAGFDLTMEQLKIYVALICLAIIGVCYLGSDAVGRYLSKLEEQNNALSSEQQTYQAQLGELKKGKVGIDIYSAAKQIETSLTNEVRYFNAIGADIPAKVWLTNFYADARGAYAIKGETTAVDDVYIFYRGIKSHVKDPSLTLSKLSVDDNGGLVDIEKASDLVYSFELTNNSFGDKKLVDPNDVVVPPVGNDANQAGGVPNLPTNLPTP